MSKYFVETDTYEKAEKIFLKESVVTFIGPPGCGKTLAAIHLIWKMYDRDWTFRKVCSWEELSYVKNDEKSLVFIDNIFFQKTMDCHLEKWWAKLKEIYDNCIAGERNELGSNRLRIVFTARPNVIEKACAYMGKITPIFNEKLLVDASKLTEREKNEIFSKQIEFATIEKQIDKAVFKNIDENFRKKARQSEGPIGFPLCAHLFVCGKDYRKSGSIFFSRPIEYLKLQIKDEINSDKSNRTKTLFFYLFFYEWHTKMGNSERSDIKNDTKCRRFLDNISKDLIENFQPFDFKKLDVEARRLSGTFFTKIDEYMYRFIHDSVYEAVGTYLCEMYVTETMKYFPLEIIQHHDFGNMSETQKITLATRLLYEALDHRLSEVFSCRVFHNERFSSTFNSELLKKDTNIIYSLLRTSDNNSVFKLPCMFWSSFYKLTLLTELFYDIIFSRNINPRYNFFAFLYGLCCTKDEGLLRTFNGMVFDNILKMENIVMVTKNEDNLILHLLISSSHSDKFVAIVVGKLVRDRVCIDQKNKFGETPLMVAVQQTISRIHVVEYLVRSSNVYLTDNKQLTVLHHLLGSCNSDIRCSQYLNTIMMNSNGKKWISKSETHGNTALSIASKNSKRSRIKSIMILLHNGKDMVNILNNNGYSALHLAVSSLKENSAIVELECCARVIAFLLYGADPNTKNDRDETAINACVYESVKEILRKPKDKDNMKETLNTLVARCKQCIENDKKPDFFEENNHLIEEDLFIDIMCFAKINFDDF